jgi:hypothetical protein
MNTLLSILGLADEAPRLTRHNDLVFDRILGITWQKNANLAATETFGISDISSDGTMSWDTAQRWIAAMNALNYLGYNDWRLPSFIDPYSWKKIGKNWGYHKNWGFRCNDSELGWMFYITVEARPRNTILSGYKAKNLALFNYIQEYAYWLGREESQKRAYCFFTENGYQTTNDKEDEYFHVWAVRDGYDDPSLWVD